MLLSDLVVLNALRRIMGSQWSSPNSGAGSGRTIAVGSRLSGRKRTHSEATNSSNQERNYGNSGNHSLPRSDDRHHDEDDDDDDEDSDCHLPRSKRSRISPLSSFMNHIWETVNDAAARWFAKYFFLTILEMATAKSKKGELSDERDILKGIITMLDYFQNKDSDILRRGWQALGVCCCCPQLPGQLPARENVIEEDMAVVAMVMEKCADQKAIQLLGVRALRVLVCIGGSASDAAKENWTFMYRAGVLSALISAMRNHFDEKVMLGLCISFIAMLMKEVGGVVQRNLIRIGGVALLIQASQKWIDDEGFFHTTCCALYQLSFQSTRQNLIDHGAIPLLVSSIMHHSENTEVIELALGIMNQLSLSDPQVFVGRQIVPLMLDVMAKHPTKETVQFYAMVLIRAIGRADAVPLQPTIDRVIDALRRFPDSSGILFFGCAVMWQLLVRHNNEQNEALTLLSNLGGLEIVTSAVHRHGEIFGLGSVAQLILLYSWEHRPADNESATVAFGGTEDVIPLITGLSDFLGNDANGNNIDDDGDTE